MRMTQVLRSAGAILVGAIVAITLTLATDLGLRSAGVADPMPEPMLLVAAAYRTLYGVISSYVVARLAPSHPMRHALIGGSIGFAVALLGAITTWNQVLGPHWYPVALVVLALPQSWAGGKLWLARSK